MIKKIDENIYVKKHIKLINHNFISLKFTDLGGGSDEMCFPQNINKWNLYRWKIINWLAPLEIKWKDDVDK